MAVISDLENKINSQIVSGEDLESVTGLLFSHISTRFENLEKMILEAYNPVTQKKEIILESGSGKKALQCNLNPIFEENFLASYLKSNGHEKVTLISDLSKDELKGFLRCKPKDINSALVINLMTKNGYVIFLEFYFRDPKNIDEDNIAFLQRAAGSFSNSLDYYLTIKNYKKKKNEFSQSLANVLELLISLIEIRDRYTSGHSNSVKTIAVLIAEQLGMEKDEINRLSNAAVLHDIGKIGITESIINKPSLLDEKEFEEIKKHPLKGAFLVSNIPSLREIGKIILHHHERYDGKGYPMGLSGNKIPLFSRIIAVADTYDAITSERPYRKRMNEKQAIEIIKDEAGKQLDPLMVDAFLKIVFKISKRGTDILDKIF
jgi:HD-GYP domain-containing protein (c-di-GMP phosphodiesterase class II)